MNKFTPAAIVAALALTLTACSTVEPADSSTPPAVVSSPTPTEQSLEAEPPASSPSVAEPSSETASPAQSEDVVFGQAASWQDGISVVLSKPRKFSPDEYAVGAEGKKHVILDVTLTNATSEKFDPSMIHFAAQSGDGEASQIYDSGNGIGEYPQTQLRAGKTVKWKIAFSVEDYNDLAVDVTPDFEHNTQMFTF
ncbi:superantigen-like protein SSL4 [Galactobacter valiniphilus]|uniref:hypothetical protein n=1 Tax=Galactobacter valiniphilus TaxID=2676122 RepID=UPI0037369EAA